MVPPINVMFGFLQHSNKVQIWLYEQTEARIEGTIRGFDEFMNVVVDDAVEVNYKKDSRRKLGRIMLKGDNITQVSSAESYA